MKTYLDDEPDDALSSKLIPVGNLLRTGAWQDAAAFTRKHLAPFKRRVAESTGQPFRVEAYGMNGVEPVILLVARPIDAAPLE